MAKYQNYVATYINYCVCVMILKFQIRIYDTYRVPTHLDMHSQTHAHNAHNNAPNAHNNDQEANQN